MNHYTSLRYLKPLLVRSPRLGPDKEDIFICVAAPVDDAVEYHQLIRDSPIVLVDNASTDGTEDYLRELGFIDDVHPTHYLRLEKNVGGAGGFSLVGTFPRKMRQMPLTTRPTGLCGQRGKRRCRRFLRTGKPEELKNTLKSDEPKVVREESEFPLDTESETR